MRTVWFYGFVLMLLTLSCKKESFITTSQANISFSQDSIYFDTLFTEMASITQYFIIYNNNDQRLRISRVAITSGPNSVFSINADGRKGPDVRDIEIGANDSVYVFVSANVDASGTAMPFIIDDSIVVEFNGNQRFVKLSAWGQNAFFLSDKIISSDTTWTNQRPIVISGGVLIPEGVKLTVQQGTKVYLHADAPFLVEGTLIAQGDRYDSTKIVFQGDRLDRIYKDLPGSWPGIYFRESSRSNLLKYVIVKNAYQGIVTEKPSMNGNVKLRLEHTIIDNCYDAGIIGVNTSIDAVNCLVSNSGKNVLLAHGGDYSFIHCTDVAVSNSYIPHKQPVLTLTDFITEQGTVLVSTTKAEFINCLFWGINGTVEDEVAVIREGTAAFDVNFTNCLWKVVKEPAEVATNAIISNKDPLFIETDPSNNRYNFNVNHGSPVIDAGVNAGVSTDLEGRSRENIPDIGAYETTF